MQALYGIGFNRSKSKGALSSRNRNRKKQKKNTDDSFSGVANIKIIGHIHQMQKNQKFLKH